MRERACVRRTSFPVEIRKTVERTAMPDEKMQTHADRSDRVDGSGILRLFNVAAWLEALAALDEEFDAILGETGSTTGPALRRPHKG
jgi:hypothetical protein